MTGRLEPDIAIRRQALRWVVRLAQENTAADDHPELQHWLGQDPLHRIAYSKAAGVYDVVGDMQHLAELAPLEESVSLRQGIAGLLHQGSRALQWLKMPVPALALAGVAALAVYVAMFVGNRSNVDPLQQTYTTKVAEIQDHTLPDGSVVTLGAQSTLKLDFVPDQRRVVLSAGEAFFAVASDPLKPFLVQAGGAVVRVVGTQFEVHRGVDGVRIAVVEGVVEVSGASKRQAPERSYQLTAGQQIVASYTGEFTPIQAIDSARSAAWRSGFLLYEDAPLREVVADANRYFSEEITLWSEKLGDLQVTASFQTDQIDGLIKSLDIALPIDVIKSDEGHIVLLPEREGGQY